MEKYQITSQIETITPAIAAEYLKNNETNRPLSQAVVKSYCETMKRGEWLLNGESIDFDWNGNLLNGQHRLNAVVKSGVTIQSFVVRNLNPKCYTSYDCGRNRTTGQLIGMQGVMNYNNVAACVRCSLILKRGVLPTEGGAETARKPTNKVMMDLFEADRSNYIKASQFSVSLRNNVGKMCFSAGYIAAIYYHLAFNLKHNIDDVEFFLSNIFSLSSSSNAMLDSLRIKFLRDVGATTRMTNEYRFRIIIKVWNAFIEGKNLKVIKWDKEKEGSIMFK